VSVKRDKERDKRRFEHLKADKKKHGQDEESATEAAAHEVKEMRKREGRSKGKKTLKKPR
jgi:hypothetical protein